MKKLVRITGLLLGVVLLFLVSVIPALAIDDPDTDPEIRAVYVYEDLLEDGDLGVLVEYFVDYTIAGTPSETITEAYLVAFIDTDGVTQLGAAAPYAYQNSGYDRGIAWIYFTAAEVTAASIDDANEALYRIWLMGNPTVASGWTGDPPITVAVVDEWRATGEGDPAILLALRVLYYADILELSWSLDLIETTPMSARLTTLGEQYFPNAITNLRLMAPNCFAVATIEPVPEDLDYTTTFGATMTDGTGTCVGSPITLVEGDNTVDITGAGTFILELEQGTEGEAVSIAGGCTVTGSPAALVAGTNTITTNLAGTNDILVTVSLVDTTTGIWALVSGGAFDTSTLAARFGMSHWAFSGLVWTALSVFVCYIFNKRSGQGRGTMMVLYGLMTIFGVLIGMMPLIIAILIGLGYTIVTGYMLFFRQANF